MPSLAGPIPTSLRPPQARGSGGASPHRSAYSIADSSSSDEGPRATTTTAAQPPSSLLTTQQRRQRRALRRQLAAAAAARGASRDDGPSAPEVLGAEALASAAALAASRRHHGLHATPWLSASASSTLQATAGRTAFPPLPAAATDEAVPAFIRRFVTAEERRTAAAERQSLREEIERHLAERQRTADTHREVIATSFAGLKAHAGVTEQIVFEVKHIERLLDRLRSDTTVDPYSEPVETLAGQRRRGAGGDAEEEEVAAVLHLRSAAAITASSAFLSSAAIGSSGGGGGNSSSAPAFDTVSVEDYSEEPPMPARSIGGAAAAGLTMLLSQTAAAAAEAEGIGGGGGSRGSYSPQQSQPLSPSASGVAAGSSSPTAGSEDTDFGELISDQPPNPHPEARAVRTIIDGIGASLRKAHFSLFFLNFLARENPLWHGSELVGRHMSAHALRANYHARKASSWAALLRSSAFVLSASANVSARAAAKDIAAENRRLAAVARREAALDKRREANAKAAAAAAAEAEALKAAIAEADVAMMSLCGTVSADPDIAETVLLLKLLEPVERLRPHLAEVRQWLELQDALGRPSCGGGGGGGLEGGGGPAARRISSVASAMGGNGRRPSTLSFTAFPSSGNTLSSQQQQQSGAAPFSGASANSNSGNGTPSSSTYPTPRTGSLQVPRGPQRRVSMLSGGAHPNSLTAHGGGGGGGPFAPRPPQA